jgi:nickel superoxide dismutase
MKALLKILDTAFPPAIIHAHCDIPCGIYDPHNAQLAAHTVIRMVGLISEKKDSVHDIARLTHVKEEHAEIVKKEIRILFQRRTSERAPTSPGSSISYHETGF